MTGNRRGGLVVLAGVVTFVALVAGFLVVKGGFGDDGGGGRGDDPDRNWTVYPEAFGPADAWQTGAALLVPDPAGCYLAVGSSGQGGGSWTAAGDCTAPVQPGGPAPGRVEDRVPSDDRSSIIDAVPAPGGGYLAIGRNRYFGDAYAYNGYALRGDPTGGWKSTAEFRGTDHRADHVGPFALARSGDRFVAVGQREQVGVAWTSADGVTWRESPLPTLEGYTSTTMFDITAGGGRLVAVGGQFANGRTPRPAAWVSTDQGATWRVSALGADEANLRTVIFDGRRFVVLGGSGGDMRSAALVATSEDGLAWTVDRSLGAAGARTIESAVAMPDGTVVAASGSGPQEQMRNRQCATAWLGGPGGWRAENLGCTGVPTTLAVVADGRVVGAHWSALFVRGIGTL